MGDGETMATERYVPLSADVGVSLEILRRRPDTVTSVLARTADHGVCLDVGCGDAATSAAIRSAGWAYLGVDAYSESSDVVGTAESLPFATAKLDAVYTNAVLEHVDDIFIAFQELARVLKPEAPLIGYVAFLEPYHELSKLHVSHVGLAGLCRANGLELVVLTPGENSLSFALRSMLFPRGAGRAAFLTRIATWPAAAFAAWVPAAIGCAKRWKHPANALRHARSRWWLSRLKYASGLHFVAIRGHGFIPPAHTGLHPQASSGTKDTPSDC